MLFYEKIKNERQQCCSVEIKLKVCLHLLIGLWLNLEAEILNDYFFQSSGSELKYRPMCEENRRPWIPMTCLLKVDYLTGS